VSRPGEGVWFEVEERIDAGPAEVFAFLTDPERYRRWMGIEAELDARPGGIYRVRMSNDLTALGEFVEVQPGRRLVFTWGWQGSAEVPPGSSTVEITLREEDGSTLLRLRHSGLPDEEAGGSHEEGWTKYLGRLRLVSTGQEPTPETP
jgi:uncharacterized protein YndB with AHSA1/START domain